MRLNLEVGAETSTITETNGRRCLGIAKANCIALVPKYLITHLDTKGKM